MTYPSDRTPTGAQQQLSLFDPIEKQSDQRTASASDITAKLKHHADLPAPPSPSGANMSNGGPHEQDGATGADTGGEQAPQEVRAICVVSPVSPPAPADTVLDQKNLTLVDCETIIHLAARSFFGLGKALAHIQQHRLYQQQYASFVDYCKQRWDMSPAHAYRAIRSMQRYETLASIPEFADQLPANEAQIRPLTTLTNPDDLCLVWSRVIDQAQSRPITAALVAEVVAACTSAQRTPPSRLVHGKPAFTRLPLRSGPPRSQPSSDKQHASEGPVTITLPPKIAVADATQKTDQPPTQPPYHPSLVTDAAPIVVVSVFVRADLPQTARQQLEQHLGLTLHPAPPNYIIPTQPGYHQWCAVLPTLDLSPDSTAPSTLGEGAP